MNTKLADLIVKKSVDYNDEVVRALEDAGFVLTKDTETFFEVSYVIAKAENENKE